MTATKAVLPDGSRPTVEAVEWLKTLLYGNVCSLMGIDENEMQFVAKPFS